MSYRFLLWIASSVGLFVFILPIDADVLIKIIAGYVFYLFVKEVFCREIEQIKDVDQRINILNERMEYLPHKTSVYIHDPEKEMAKKKKDDNLDRYL